MKKSTVILAAFLLTSVLWPRIEHTDRANRQRQFALALDFCRHARADGKPGKCQLYGKIQIVEHFPDVEVKVVEHFPDLEVEIVEHFPDEPGKWQMVDNFPDYKVKFVEHFPDYKVKFVEHFPGCE